MTYVITKTKKTGWRRFLQNGIFRPSPPAFPVRHPCVQSDDGGAMHVYPVTAADLAQLIAPLHACIRATENICFDPKIKLPTPGLPIFKMEQQQRMLGFLTIKTNGQSIVSHVYAMPGTVLSEEGRAMLIACYDSAYGSSLKPDGLPEPASVLRQLGFTDHHHLEVACQQFYQWLQRCRLCEKA